MVEADRYVNLTVKYDKGRLFVNIDNPYKGKLIEENGNYSTTKIDVGQHGIGLESVKTALQKYDGMIEISQENNVFTARVLMYID
ncbi:MAG: GHKL domain-containing protein, partial [Hungatella sp.]